MHFLAQLVRIVLIGLLVIAPWFFGAVWAQVQWVIMLVVGLLMALELVSRFGDDDRPNLIPAAWVPILGGLVLGLVQLVNWPSGFAETMAPRTLQLRAELTTDDGTSEVAVAEMGKAIGVTQRTRSVYPLATREYSALLALAMSVFVLASIHLVNKQSVQWTFIAVAVCGTALSFFGLIQRLSWNGKFYWIIEPLSGGFQSFGPFVNRNNAGGFLNLCLAASVGLLVWLHWKPEMDAARPDDADLRRRTRRGTRRSSSEGRRRSSVPEATRREATSGTSPTSHSSPRTLDAESEKVGQHEVAPTPPGRGESTPRAQSTTEETVIDGTIDAASDRSSEPTAAASDETSGGGSFEDQLRAAYEASRAEAIDPTSTDLPTPPQTDSTTTDSQSSPSSTSKPWTAKPASRTSSEGSTKRRRSNGSGSRAAGRSGSRSTASNAVGAAGERAQSTRFGDAAYPGAYGKSGASRKESTWNKLSGVASNYFAELNAPRVWALLLVGFSAGGVLSSASRGSILAMFAATMVTITALMFRRGQRGYAAGLLVMLVAGLGLMSWAGQTEFVKQRFELMFEQNSLERGRLPNWLEATRAVPQFPWLGSGLGTYRWVYERYQERFLDRTIHTHAENQFLQTLVEAGFVGLGFLIIEICLVALAIVKLFRAGGQVNTSLALMGTFALTSQLFGGCFDFGLYIPSNTMMMAALCGMVIGRAALLSIWPDEALNAIDAPMGVVNASAISDAFDTDAYSDVESPPELAEEGVISSVAHSRRARRAANRSVDRHVLLGLTAPAYLSTFLIGFLLLGCLFGSLELNKASKIEAALRPVQLQDLSRSEEVATIDAALQPLARVLPQRWDDAIAHQELARLMMQQYRATVYNQLLQEKQRTLGSPSEPGTETDGGASPPKRDADLWARAAVVHLHGSIRQLQRANRSKAAAELINSEVVREHLVPARRHLLLSRQIAPTIPETHFLLGELSAISNDDESRHLERAQLLSPGNATIWFWSGLLNLNSGRDDAACAAWNQCLELTPQFLDDIVLSTQRKLTIKRLLFDIIPLRADMLLATARKHFSQENRLKYRAAFVARAEEALPKTDLPPAEHAYTAAWIYWLQGRVDEAEPQFSLAINRNSTNLNWRREYIQLLLELKEYNKAHEHATYLVRAKPKNKGYERLLRQVNSLRLRQVD